MIEFARHVKIVSIVCFRTSLDNKFYLVTLIFLAILLQPRTSSPQPRSLQRRAASGVLEGAVSADGKFRSFKGIPFAAPPVGPLRWKPPQPVAPWPGVRKAIEFGPRCMQTRVYTDMIFRDAGPSEDCLYLNVWMPAAHSETKLPVMVWVYGGAFVAGSSSEPRQDAGVLCQKGVVVVTMNYRLGVFGFFSHPELSKESGHNASGNYGLMDQLAALQWIKQNIAVFGGDPDNVTIFGESAGSSSVSALMASPLAKGLFRRAIGESGAIFGAARPMKLRAETEKTGTEFAKAAFGTDSLEALRAKPAADLLQVAAKEGVPRFSPNVDGYFLPDSVQAIFLAGKQSHVPLLAGWNLDEGSYHSILDDEAPTPENFAAKIRLLYGANSDAILKLYPATSEAEVKRAAQDLAGDRFTAFTTWKWMELHLKTGRSPVYCYRFEETLPLAASSAPDSETSAPHASEIEFVFEMLSSEDLPWRPQDEKVSDLMSSYWTNFAKAGDPNGAGLPKWPSYGPQTYQVMHLNAKPQALPDDHRARYLFHDQVR
jgi:para-nitrobenzyl esterase